MYKRGFSLIEILVIVAMVGVIASIILVALGRARTRARDVRRKVDITQIGRLVVSSVCYTPDAGAGEYDLAVLVPELVTKYPQYAQYASQLPRDPARGTENQTYYIYGVNAAGKCALWANLENADEPITLSAPIAPGPGTGIGVLQAAAPGWNGTDKYLQVAN